MRLALRLLAYASLAAIPLQDAPKKKFFVGFSQCNNAEPWRQAMNAAARAEAEKHPEIELVFADAAQDNAKQVADVENFLTQRVDLLIISPNEAKPLTKVVKRAFESGTPVVVLDRAIGRAAGVWVAMAIGGKGKVVELKGLMGSTPAQERSAGFRGAIA